MDYYTSHQHYPGEAQAPGTQLLVILGHIPESEEQSEVLLSDPTNEIILDYLEGLEGITWAVTYLFPEVLGAKAKKADIENAKPRILELVQTLGPTVVLTLGGDALTALWPDTKGKVPPINKARTLVTELGGPGRYLLTSYDPKIHHTYLTTNGYRGQDLNEEYTSCFARVADLLEGKYTAPEITPIVLTSYDSIIEVSSYMTAHGVNLVSVDVEDDTWIPPGKGVKLKPHEWELKYPDLVMDEKLTQWGPDNKLLVLGFSFMVATVYGREIKTYIIPEELLQDRDRVCWILEMLLRRRWLLAWNSDYELTCFFIRAGFLWWQHEVFILEPMFRESLRDQSLPGIGLKPTAQTKLNAPPWDLELQAELTEARERRKKAGGPSVSSMGEVSRSVLHLYNGFDTYWPLRLWFDYYALDRDGGVPEGNIAYEFLLECQPWITAMEREGLHVDLGYLRQTIITLEQECQQLESDIRSDSYVQRAEQLTGKTYNPRSPIFYEHLVAITVGSVETDRGGEIVLKCPPDIPRTKKSRQLKRGKDIIAQLAGNHPETYAEIIPIPDKTPGQLCWYKILQHLLRVDYLTKFYTILNYTTEDNLNENSGRLNTSYRLVRTEGTDDEGSGGTVSGRTASSPNVQNRQNDSRILRCFTAPPGFVVVSLDFSRAELVWLGFNTGDPLLCQWAREGRDQHLERGAALWGIANGRPMEEFWQFRPRELAAAEDPGPSVEQKPWRNKGKTMNFADVYLQEPTTLAAITGMTPDEAFELAHLSMMAHPAVHAAKIDLYERLNSGGVARSYLLGRIRSAPGWEPSDQSGADFFSLDPEQRKRRNMDNMSLFRSLWNTEGAQADANDCTMSQGRWIYAKLMAHDPELLEQLLTQCYYHNLLSPERVAELRASRDWLNPDWVKPHNFIHDDLRFYVHENYVDVAVPALAREMASLKGLPREMDLPLGVGAKIGYTEDSMKPYVWE